MSIHRTTFRQTALAILGAALGAALLAGPAGARPVHPLVLPADRPVPVHHPALVSVAPPAGTTSRFHDSIAPATGTVPQLHDSIAPATGTVPQFHDSIAPATRVSGPHSGLVPLVSNPRVFAAIGPVPAGSGSDVAWLEIGLGVLGAALITGGVLTLRRERPSSARMAPHGTPSFGA